MKSKIISLAFLLVFAFSTSAFADGEIGSGNRTDPQPPPPSAAQSNSSSNDLLTQIITVIASIIP